MQSTLFAYIWQGSKKGHVVVFLLTMLALPFYYVSLELPKLVVNGVLGAQPGNFPIEISAAGRKLVELERVDWLIVLCISFLLAVAAQGGVKFLLNVYKGRLGGQQESFESEFHYVLLPSVFVRWDSPERARFEPVR